MSDGRAKREERLKQLQNTVAMAANNPLLPAMARVALALALDELRDLVRRVEELELNGGNR